MQRLRRRAEDEQVGVHGDAGAFDLHVVGVEVGVHDDALPFQVADEFGQRIAAVADQVNGAGDGDVLLLVGVPRRVVKHVALEHRVGARVVALRLRLQALVVVVQHAHLRQVIVNDLEQLDRRLVPRLGLAVLADAMDAERQAGRDLVRRAEVDVCRGAVLVDADDAPVQLDRGGRVVAEVSLQPGDDQLLLADLVLQGADGGVGDGELLIDLALFRIVGQQLLARFLALVVRVQPRLLDVLEVVVQLDVGVLGELGQLLLVLLDLLGQLVLGVLLEAFRLGLVGAQLVDLGGQCLVALLQAREDGSVPVSGHPPKRF